MKHALATKDDKLDASVDNDTHELQPPQKRARHDDTTTAAAAVSEGEKSSPTTESPSSSDNEEEEEEEVKNDDNDNGYIDTEHRNVFDLCSTLDHIACKYPPLRDTIKGVIGRHALPSRLYVKYKMLLEADDRSTDQTEEEAAEMCTLYCTDAWEYMPDWKSFSEADTVSFYRDYDPSSEGEEEDPERNEEEEEAEREEKGKEAASTNEGEAEPTFGPHARRVDPSLAAAILVHNLRLEREKTIGAIRFGAHTCMPELLPVYEDAIASLLPLAPATCAVDPFPERKRHETCFKLQTVRDDYPALALFLDPIIARHGVPKEAYDRAVKGFTDGSLDADWGSIKDMCTLATWDLWPGDDDDDDDGKNEGDEETDQGRSKRPAWAKDVNALCFTEKAPGSDELRYPVPLDVASTILYRNIEALAKDIEDDMRTYDILSFETEELMIHGEVANALRPVAEARHAEATE